MRHRSKEFINAYNDTKPYGITEYENVFVLLKKGIEVPMHLKPRCYFDLKKERHYFHGRIIDWKITNEEGHYITSYPKTKTIALVDHKDWNQYKNLKYNKAKELKIQNIQFSLIDFITLDFNSFDWDK